MEARIILKVKDKEINLTTKQAKELLEILDELVGPKTVERYIPSYWRCTPYVYWDYNQITGSHTSIPTYEITCKS